MKLIKQKSPIIACLTTGTIPSAVSSLSPSLVSLLPSDDLSGVLVRDSADLGLGVAGGPFGLADPLPFPAPPFLSAFLLAAAAAAIDTKKGKIFT